MSQKKIGLFWFTNDLRLHDNPALMRANSLVDELLCIAIEPTELASPTAYQYQKQSSSKQRFQAQSLITLNQQLQTLGQQLWFVQQSAIENVLRVIDDCQVTHVFSSINAGWYEQRFWQLLNKHRPSLEFQQIATHTLYEQEDLPFELYKLPKSFTKFRFNIEKQAPSKPLAAISHLPTMPINTKAILAEISQPIVLPSDVKEFNGGELAGLEHLKAYFSSDHPGVYKQVRNNLDGWGNSSKLSPWLANGCLSAREVYSELKHYEATVVANDSTYWLFFELLWREYFQWYAHKLGTRLFSLSGIKGVSPLNSYYPERFKKWVHGCTPYPLVNACMNQLAATGFMSNRGRQIVASCFVNELAMDWRFGAAYFESALIDYDVASNWGNWQYLGGVGADSRDKRHFNLQKQSEIYDPNGEFIAKWNGAEHVQPLDTVDAADWPI